MAVVFHARNVSGSILDFPWGRHDWENNFHAYVTTETGASVARLRRNPILESVVSAHLGPGQEHAGTSAPRGVFPGFLVVRGSTRDACGPRAVLG